MQVEAALRVEDHQEVLAVLLVQGLLFLLEDPEVLGHPSIPEDLGYH